MRNASAAVTPRKTTRSGVREFGGRDGPDEAAEGARGRRDREPDEPPLVHDVDLDVEAGEARGAADREEEGDEEARAAEGREPPVVDEKGGRDAEGDDVAEGVQLLAERGGRPGQPGDAPVDPVEERRDEDEDRRGLERPPGGGVEREKAAEDVARGEERGQHVDPPANPAARGVRRGVGQGRA